MFLAIFWEYAVNLSMWMQLCGTEIIPTTNFRAQGPVRMRCCSPLSRGKLTRTRLKLHGDNYWESGSVGCSRPLVSMSPTGTPWALGEGCHRGSHCLLMGMVRSLRLPPTTDISKKAFPISISNLFRSGTLSSWNRWRFFIVREFNTSRKLRGSQVPIEVTTTMFKRNY